MITTISAFMVKITPPRRAEGQEHRDQHAGRGAERAAERKGEGRDARHVDADEAGRGRVDRDRPHRRAGPRPGQRQVEAEADDHGEEEGEQPVGGDRRAEHVDRHQEVGVAVELAAEDRQHQPLHHEQEAEGEEDRVALELVAGLGALDQRREQEVVDQPVQDEGRRHDQDQPGERAHRARGEQPPRGEGGGDDELAIGEVHDPGDAVLQRQPQRHGGVETAEDQPRDDDLDDDHAWTTAGACFEARASRSHLSMREGMSSIAGAMAAPQMEYTNLLILRCSIAERSSLEGRPSFVQVCASRPATRWRPYCAGFHAGLGATGSCAPAIDVGASP